MNVVVFGEREVSEAEDGPAEESRTRDSSEGSCLGKRVAFGAAPEPGGPAATKFVRRVGSLDLSRGDFPSA
jgi:hypothetical protein